MIAKKYAIAAAFAVLGFVLFAGPTSQVGISAVTSFFSFDTAHPLEYLVDSSPATEARFASGTSSGSFVVELSSCVTVVNLDLAGSSTPGAYLSIEYELDGAWIPFASASFVPLSFDFGRKTVDLSPDRAATQRIRCTVFGSADSVLLGSIAVYGETHGDRIRKIQPKSVVASENTSFYATELDLFDEDPETVWLTEQSADWSLINPFVHDFAKARFVWERESAGWLEGFVRASLDAPRYVDSIRLYAGSRAKGMFALDVSNPDGSWTEIVSMRRAENAGWLSFAVGREIGGVRIRVVTDREKNEFAGFGELEIWGRAGNEPASPARSFVLGEGPEGVSVGLFRWEGAWGQSVRVLAAYPAGVTNPPNMEMNGTTIPVNASVRTGDALLAEYRVPYGLVVPDSAENFFSIVPNTDGTTVRARAIVFSVPSYGGALVPVGPLGDGAVATTAATGNEWRFHWPVSIRKIVAYGRDVLLGGIEAWINGEWKSISRDADGDYACDGLITDALRPVGGAGNLAEIRAWGSPARSRDLSLSLLYPTTNAQYAVEENGYEALFGEVNDPGAVVTVNGKTAKRYGRYFWIEMNALGLSGSARAEVTISAVSADGRTRSIRTGWYNAANAYELTLADTGVAYVRDATYVVRGTFNPWVTDINVADIRAAYSGSAFSRQVDLNMGLNLIEVRQIERDTGKIVNLQYVKVYRVPGQLSVAITSHPASFSTSVRSISLAGTVRGISPISVKVNGKKTSVSGGFWSAPELSLKEGPNILTVEAIDASGALATASVTVTVDSTAPVVTVESPVSGRSHKGPIVVISGTVSDAGIARVFANGVVAPVECGRYTLDAAFDDGEREVAIYAVDAAGNRSQTKVIRFVSDATPPEPFDIALLPGDISNESVVQAVFEATDRMTGVVGYRAAVDGDAETAVSSPYTTEPLADGTHIIHICAVDAVGNERMVAKVFTVDAVAPPAIYPLRIVSAEGRVTLSWEAPSSDTSFYRVVRVPAWSDGARVVKTPVLVDTDVENGGSYRYSVVAVDHALNESPAVEASATEGVVEASVVPGKGLFVEFDRASLVIPAESLPDDCAGVRVTTVRSEELESTLSFDPVSSVYDFSYLVSEGDSLVEKPNAGFGGAVTVIVRYDQSAVPADFPERNLGVYFFDAQWSRWRRVLGALVDVEQNIIAFQTDHFSIYTVAPTVEEPLSPQEMQDQGYSPLASLNRHAGMDVSTQGGTLRTDTTEFELFGTNGFSFPVGRDYNSDRARSDTARQLFCAEWSYSAAGSMKFTDFVKQYIKGRVLSERNVKRLQNIYSQEGDYAYSMGIGWRLNLPYLSADENALAVRLPDGLRYSTALMTDKTPPLSAGQEEAKTRTLIFENHLTTDFTLYVSQKKQDMTLDGGLPTSIKLPTWRVSKAVVVMKSGARYEFDSFGQLTRVLDPQGINEVTVTYEGRAIKEIAGPLGRKLLFEYESGPLFFPLIKKITLSYPLDSVEKVAAFSVSYGHADIDGGTDLSKALFPLLVSATDAEGRKMSYAYVQKAYIPSNGSGVSVDFLKKLNKLCDDNTMDIAIPKRLSASSSTSVSVACVLSEVSGPGVGRTTIETGIMRYSYKSRLSDLLIGNEALTPDARQEQETCVRLMTTAVTERPDAEAGDEDPSRQTTYAYTLAEGRVGQTLSGKTVVTTERMETTVEYGTFEMTKHYLTGGTDLEYIPYEKKRVVARREGEGVVPYETVDRGYDGDTLRLTTERVSRSIRSYRNLSLAYDEWGNVTSRIEQWSEGVVDGFLSVGDRSTETVYRAVAPLDVMQAASFFLTGSSGAATDPTPSAYIHGLPEKETLRFSDMPDSALPPRVEYEYNQDGQLTKKTEDADGLALETAYEYYPANVADDSMRKLLSKVTSPFGNGKTRVVEYAYDYPAAAASGDIAVTRTDRSVELGGGAVIDAYEKTIYSRAWGKPLSIERNIGGVRTADVYRESYGYDDIGRVTSVSAPGGTDGSLRTTSVSYDDENLQVTVIGRRGQRSVYSYDDWGQVSTIRRFRSASGQEDAVEETAVEYDLFGGVTAIVAPGGVRTEYAYDNLGRTTAIILPAITVDGKETRGKTSFAYDDETNTQTVTDEKGLVTVTGFSFFGRPRETTQSYTGRSGRTSSSTRVSYDGLGRERISRDARGLAKTIVYDNLGRIARESYSERTIYAGSTRSTIMPVYAYTYDDAGYVTGIDYRDGEAGSSLKRIDFAVNSLGFVLSRTEYESGAPRETQYAYDAFGRKIKEWDPLDLATPVSTRKCLSWDYSASGKVLTETDRAGIAARYEYDADDNLTKAVDPRKADENEYQVIYAYDDLGRLVSASLPDHADDGATISVSLAYDLRGNLLERRESNGLTTNYTYAGYSLPVTETRTYGSTTLYERAITYDGRYLPVSMTTGGGTAAEREYYTYDERGMATVSAKGGTAASPLTSATRWFDAAGDVVEETDGEGNATTWTYDLYGQRSSDTDAAGKTTTYGYDAFGNASYLRDRLGRQTTVSYNELGQKTAETRANGAVTRFAYDPAGRLVAQTDPDGAVTDYEYDLSYRVRTITKKSVDGTTGVKSITYDKAGNITEKTSDGATMAYDLNAYGEPRAVTRGTGENIAYALLSDGRVANIAPKNGAAPLALVAYDYANPAWLSGIRDAGGTTPASIVSSFAYATNGRMTDITGANNVSIGYSFDTAGRLSGIALTGAASGSYAFEYFKDNSVKRKNDNAYQYDALRRLITSTERNPTPRRKTVEAETVTGDYRGVSELALAASDVTITLDAGGMSVGKTFAGNVELTELTVTPLLKAHRVGTDNLRVYASSGGAWTRIAPTAYAVRLAADSGAISIEFSPPITASGVKVNCLWDERTIDYSVDESYATFKNRADRILTIRYIDRNRTTTYQYDAEGNRTQQVQSDSLGGTATTAYTYWPNTDHLKTDGTYAYVYDAVGNLVEKGTSYTETSTTITYAAEKGVYWKYAYDVWGHLVKVEKSEAGTASLVPIMTADYDANGILRTKTKGTKTWRYWYGADGNMLYQTLTDAETPAASWAKSFTYAAGKLISYAETRNSVTTRYWVVTDQIGSVVKEMDASGAIVAEQEYASFGTDPDSGTASGHETLRWYAGKEWDGDVELYYFNARWYDPELGRFITEDPARDDSNWYVYCLNSPETYVDPSGMYHYAGSEMVADATDEPGKDSAGYPNATPYGADFDYEHSANYEMRHLDGTSFESELDMGLAKRANEYIWVAKSKTKTLPPAKVESVIVEAEDTTSEVSAVDGDIEGPDYTNRGGAEDANKRVQMGERGIADDGPCLFMCYLGVAQTYAKKTLTEEQAKKLYDDDDLWDNKGKFDPSYPGVIILKALEVLGVDTKKLVVDYSDRKTPDKNAFANLRHVKRRDATKDEAGHWQEGTSKGEFYWDPKDGWNDIGRKVFEYRSISITTMMR